MNAKQIEQAKYQMEIYVDFFGGSLIDKEKISEAKSIEDLEYIFSRHHDYITDMATDAQASLERFKRKIGVKL